MPRGYAGETRNGRCANGDVPTGLRCLFADTLAKENICVEEIPEEFGEEGVVVCSDQFDAVAAFKSCITKQV